MTVLASSLTFSHEPIAAKRIINGNEVSIQDDWSWVVAIVQSNAMIAHDSFSCSGSLIAADWVLTAAHCVEGKGADELDVLISRHNLLTAQGERIAIEQIYRHPLYTQASVSGYDIALIKLKHETHASNTPVPLINTTQMASLSAGDGLTVLGWGTTSTSHLVMSPVLREVDVPLVADSVCQSVYYTANHTMLCAGYDMGGKDACQGDSGGPLIRSIDGQRYLVGVVSWGGGCALPSLYGVYSKISVLRDWIKQYINIDDSLSTEMFSNENKFSYFVPLLNAADNYNEDPFIRFVNKTALAGKVSLLAYNDDNSNSKQVVSFILQPYESRQITAEHFEYNPEDRGLSGSIGYAQGNWHIDVQSSVELSLFSMIRYDDGSLVDVSQSFKSDEFNQVHIDFVNPASNNNQQSILRIINPGNYSTQVVIKAVDDSGRHPHAVLSFELKPHTVKLLTSEILENGGNGFSGSLGDGTGKWALMIQSEQAINIMNLIQIGTRLSNLAPLHQNKVSPCTEQQAISVTNKDKIECLTGEWNFLYNIVSHYQQYYFLDKIQLINSAAKKYEIIGSTINENTTISAEYDNDYMLIEYGNLINKLYIFNFESNDYISGCYYQIDNANGISSHCYPMRGHRLVFYNDERSVMIKDNEKQAQMEEQAQVEEQAMQQLISDLNYIDIRQLSYEERMRYNMQLINH